MKSRIVLIVAFVVPVALLAILFGRRAAEESSPGAPPSTASAERAAKQRAATPIPIERGPEVKASDYVNSPMVEERTQKLAREPTVERSSETPPASDPSSALRADAANPPGTRRGRIPAECWGLRGSAPHDYVVTLDRNVRTSGVASALITSRRDTADRSHYVTMFQTSSAAPVKGRRVEFSADIRTRGAIGGANLLLRAEDASGRTVAFDNMTASYDAERRPDRLINTGVTGDTEWSTQHVVVDIPSEAAVITYGVSFFGGGKTWIDNARVEVVSEEVPTTAVDMLQSPVPVNGIPVDPASLERLPQNLEFDLESGTGAASCN